MVTNELLEYIKKEHTKGVPLDSIKKVLESNKWSNEDIEEALKNLFPTNISKIQPQNTPIVSSINPIPNNIVMNSSLNINPQIQPVVQKRKSHLVAIILVIIMVILGAGAFYGFIFGYFLYFPSLINKTTNFITETKSFSFESTTTIDYSKVKNDFISSMLSEKSDSLKKMDISLKGGFDFINAEDFKSILELGFSAGDINAVIESRVKDSILYASIKKMPKISFIEQFLSFEGKWVNMSLVKEETTEAMNPLDSFNLYGLDRKSFGDLTDAQKDKLLEISKNASFIKITKRFLPEKIDGEYMYHFAFEFDREGIKTYLKNIQDYLKTELNNFENTSIAKENVDDMKDPLNNFKGEVWISMKENIPRKLSVSFDVVDPEKLEDGQVSISNTIYLKDWNKPLNVPVPEGSKSFEEIFKQFSDEAEIKNLQNSIKPIFTELPKRSKLYFDKNIKKGKGSYKGFCLSREIKNMSAFVKGKTTYNVDCIDADSKYMISTKITENSYLCVDVSGAIKTLEKKPVDMICE
jgi:hypothetical protein